MKITTTKLKKYEANEILVFNKVIRYLKASFVFVPENWEFSLKYSFLWTVGYILFTSPLSIGTIGHLYMSIMDNLSARIICEDVFILIFIISSYHFSIAFTAQGNRYVRIMQHFFDPRYEHDEDFRKLVDMLDKLRLCIFYSPIVVIIAYTSLSYIGQAHCDERMQKDPHFLCGMIVPAWFSIPMGYFPLQEIFLAYTLAYAFLIIPPNLTINVFIHGFLGLVVMRIEQLKAMLETIRFNGDDKALSKYQLRFGIKDYGEILLLFKEVNVIVGNQIAFLQHAAMTVTIALLEYQIMDGYMLAASQLMVWMVMFCTAGQIIENASESLAAVVYNMPWYEMDPSLRKTFTIFHSEVGNTLHLQVPPSVNINLEFLHKVLKASYSLLTFLKSF